MDNNESMCSPSSDNLYRHRRSHNNNCNQQMQQHKLFDSSRKFLHKTHKFITADLCIVVDGQNYESYRHATADFCKMKMMNRSCNDLSKFYKPVSSRGSGAGSMKQSTSSATLSTAESSSYTTCDHQLDVSQRSASPPHMLDWLRSATAQRQKKQQQQQDRDRSSQSSLPDLEAIRRRRASASGSSKQRRRHSLQEIDPARISAARRLSGQSTSSESSSQPRVKLLHASKPMHRTLSNQDIPGILRPARYSSTNLADMAAGYESGVSSPLRREINRISNDMKKASLLDATSSHRLDFRPVRSFTRRSTASSTGQLQNNRSRLQQQQQAGRSLSRMNSKPNHEIETKNAEWVASGVNFSQNMEVFVFQKR